MGRHFAANGITFLIVGLVVIYGLVNLGISRFQEPGPLTEAAIFEVKSGETFTGASENLKEAGIISSAFIFRTGSRYSGINGSDLKAGVFSIPAGATMLDVAKQITSNAGAASRYQLTYVPRGDGVEARLRDLLGEGGTITDTDEIARILDETTGVAYRVTFAEGSTSWEITQALERIETLQGEIAEVPPEGSLAPNTYAFRAGSTRQSILDQMTSAQDAIIENAWANRAPDLPINSPEEMLILASVIEREAGGAEEWRRVASVFVNRLNRGMRLEADATVRYGITLGREKLGRGLRRSELDRVTPYNTYRVDGLPPTPIANPGRAAIEATVTPETTDFLFFVADGTGGHAFAQTLAEHEENVRVWRQIEAERAASEGSSSN